jgi:hypothetical protein
LAGSITRYTLSSGTQVVPVAVGAASRVIIRVSETTRIANDEGELSSNYFTMNAGTMVLDPPNLLNDGFLYFRLDSATSGIVEVWLQGCVY